MSVSNQARRRGQMLNEIMAYHREQLPKIMRATPLADVQSLALTAPPPLDFYAALKSPGVSLIAECKKASPSQGLLLADYDPATLARLYVRGGASAISVLTDGRHFQGSLTHLRDVKEALSADAASARRPAANAPVLRKDFIFHPYQVYEARAAGADAILLIAAVLAPGQLKELLGLARTLGMEALIEVHSETELGWVLQTQPRVVGVNNRNLQTFEVDFGNTARLQRQIPAGIVTVAESGIQSAEQVRTLRALGVDAILVGELLVRSRDPLATVRSLVAAGRAQGDKDGN